MKRTSILLAAGILWGCGQSETATPTGTAGTNGAAGASGSAGTSGAAGTGGTTGSGGSVGDAGTSGAAGTGGATSVAGTGGTAGAAGSAGTAGNAGRGGAGGGAAGRGGATAGVGGSAAGAGGAAGRGGTGGGAGATGRGGSSGTTGSAGTGGGTLDLPFSFLIGADVTDQEPRPVATRANLLTTMKAHGFNTIRLRTFVDPRAADGYDKTNGYDDIDHTVAFGQQIKAAGMGLLVDFHYSDNWADPGKQCVPVAWQGFTTVADMATAVHDYTKDAITKLVAGGARPDMVQIGNETTPGMLIHRCDGGGQPMGNFNPINGAIYGSGGTTNGGWAALGAFFKAGVAGVKEVDAGIMISLHIDRGNDLASSRSYIMNAQTQGVAFDAFGESCYTAYQGMPSAWQNTFTMLASQFPSLKFFIAEYGPEQKAANDMMFNLANQRGIGTFNWEPTTRGAWNDPNHDLLRLSGSTYTAQPDLALYDQMKIDYASRL